MRKLAAIFEVLVTRSLEKIFCHKFHVSISGGQNFNFQINRKYASIELENHFQLVKSRFSVVLSIGATISLRDEMI